MEFEADTVSLRDVEERDEHTPAIEFLDVIFRACPELDMINFRAEAEDGAADLVALVELLTHERHGKTLPALIEQRWVVLHREHLLAAVCVRLVLPHQLDARLEQVVVRVALEFRRRLQLGEVLAIRLASVEITHSCQTGFVRPRISQSRI